WVGTQAEDTTSEGSPEDASNFRFLLNSLHIIVREAEMMADLVHEHVSDDVPKGFIIFGPVIENGAAVQEDHVGLGCRVAEAFPIEAYSRVKAHKIEWALDAELLQHLFGREVLHANYEISTHVTEMLRQPFPRLSGQDLQVFQAG